MTSENSDYGYGWSKCLRCKVHQATAHLNGEQLCKDLEQCERWRLELAAAPPRDERDNLKYNHRNGKR